MAATGLGGTWLFLTTLLHQIHAIEDITYEVTILF